MYIIQEHTMIANAFYASNQDFITYEDLNTYRTILYRNITKKYKYIGFEDNDEDFITIDNHTFVKTPDGIYNMNQIENEFIENLNSSYPEDIQEMFKLSNKTFNSIKNTNPQKKKGVLVN